MSVSRETLRAIVREYQGFEVDDDALDEILIELEGYFSEREKLRELDLSDMRSARLLRAKEGGEA